MPAVTVGAGSEVMTSCVLVETVIAKGWVVSVANPVDVASIE